MTLLRRVLGETLRGQRLRQRRTLREVSGAARVSLGYLSEVERGQKEASSELLASICDALDVRMSDVLREVSDTMRRTERVADVARAPTRTLVPAGVGAGSSGRQDRPRGGDGAQLPVDGGFDASRDQAGPAAVLPAEVPAAELPPGEVSAAEATPAGIAGSGIDELRLDVEGLGELDGIDLADLETGDGLGEVEALLGLTELAGRPDRPFGPCMLRLTGAAA